MKSQYRTVLFNNERFDNVFNAYLDNDVYSDSLIGERTVVEEKIPGRDLPYFYRVDSSTLEFDLVLAFESPLSMSQIKDYIRKFLTPRTYAELQLKDDEWNTTPIYKVIFIGSPTLDHIYQGDDGYYGYFSLRAKCNAPYGFERGITGMDTTQVYLELENVMSDLPSQEYEIAIQNNLADVEFPIQLNVINSIYSQNINSNIGFSAIYPGELIYINGNTKRITSEFPNSEPPSKYINIYERWNKNFITIEPGYNKIEKTNVNAVVDIYYELPRIL